MSGQIGKPDRGLTRRDLIKGVGIAAAVAAIALVVIAWQLRSRRAAVDQAVQRRQSNSLPAVSAQSAPRIKTNAAGSIPGGDTARWDATPDDDGAKTVATNSIDTVATTLPAVATNSIVTVATKLPLPRFVRSHRARVPPGGALVTGGWPQPNGNRLLMFASPQATDGGEILVITRFVSLPPSRFGGGGWERFMTDDAVTFEGGVYSAEEYQAFMKNIETFDDVRLHPASELMMRPDSLATIESCETTIVIEGGRLVEKPLGEWQGIIARRVDGSSDVDLAITSAKYDSRVKSP